MKETVQQAAALIAKNVPSKIFLQIGDDGDLPEDWDFKDSDVEYVTWCANRINETDIEYVLAGHSYAGEGIPNTWQWVKDNKYPERNERVLRYWHRDSRPNGESLYDFGVVLDENGFRFGSVLAWKRIDDIDEPPSDAVESEAVAFFDWAKDYKKREWEKLDKTLSPDKLTEQYMKIKALTTVELFTIYKNRHK